MSGASRQRQSWGSKFGVIMAVAGSAVGLGNFLRFPVQAVNNGGGAFMIPYFISIVFIGIPLMWVEWTIGRYGGGFGHSTAPGIFYTMTSKNRFIKYFGVIGIFGPLAILMFYTYIESWLLAYSWYALTGKLSHAAVSETSMQAFLAGFQGVEKNAYFSSLVPAYTFFCVTFCINLWIIYYGIRRGIEKFCRIAMPVLFLFALVITVRVLTLGVPDIAQPENNVVNGLGFLWNPDFSALKSARVWLAAAGQVFFTLSVGIGVILTYASYLKKEDDIVLSGLSAVGTNEFCEVILGGSIVIPAAFVFFGAAGMKAIAGGGAFNLGFVTMPLIFNKLAFGALFAFMWFVLLFLAGVTSSVSLAQPAVAFMEDEFDWNRKKAVSVYGVLSFLLCQPAVFFLARGVVDELDFWGGTVALVVFGTVEAIIFSWIFGIGRAWEEMHAGADIIIPRIYKFILQYITPVFLLCILGWWFYQDWIPVIMMKNVSAENYPYVMGIRLLLLSLFLGLAVAVKLAWRRRRKP